MKNIFIILTLFFSLLGTNIKIAACSPRNLTIEELIGEYNRGYLSVVEGYFVPNGKGIFTSKFVVTGTSDSFIKIGQEYQVYEYGPFGSQCEMYEMENSIDNKEAGKNKPRLLFIYKNRSKNNKLVTPIFWGKGAKINSSTLSVVQSKYDNQKKNYIPYQYSTSLNEFWKQVALRKPLNIRWDEKRMEK